MLWHLPTVGIFIGLGIVIAIAVFLIVNFDRLARRLRPRSGLPASCFQVWTVIFALVPMWFGGRFIFRRLVWNFRPPEKEKRLKEDEME